MSSSVAAAALGAAQIARLASLPETLGSTGALREVLLEGFRQRNAVLDFVFYDTDALGAAEVARLVEHRVTDGMILVVPPTGGGPVSDPLTIEEFAEGHAGSVRSLAVAGVGSSALGAAALARNVADARGEAVAAVVSGYGLSDLAAEALGGWFLFGALNAIRHAFATLDPDLPAFSGRLRPWAAAADVATVMALLGDPRFRFDLLAGHSKGNLVLSEALFALRLLDRPRLAVIGASARIVTLSAIVAMPPECVNVVDVIGEYDAFGALNSRPDIMPEILVPGALHHTSTAFPAHLPVRRAVEDALALDLGR